ncbi:MAG: glycosyltransferase [Candidatus Omnitrophota bacterium]
MYISEVSGHHSATIAIEKAIKVIAPNTEIMNINAFNYTNPISEKIINRLYMGVIKATPQIWDYLYDNPSVVKKLANIKESIHKMNSPKLKKLFDEFKPDAVCCTQAFPCGMVSDYKKTYDSAIPLVAVLTDYIPHAYWIYDNVDYYIVPSEEVGQRMVKKGVAPAKVRALGIPFNHKFNEPVDRQKTIQRLGLDSGLPTILIMGGGQGLGPIKIVVKALEKVKPEFQAIVVTGTNKKLYNSLSRKIKKFKRKLLLFGYTDRINELMTVSDVVVTKPGGITTAEALSKNLPMIIIKPIPGQEANNTAYLLEKQAAIRIDDPKAINLIFDELLSQRGKLAKLAEAAAAISKPNASFDIARLILGLK